MNFKLWINEDANIKLYHGSQKKFEPGFKLLPQVGGYAWWYENRPLEDFFEKHRPPDKISRFHCVFLVDDPEMCENAGGYDDHIYLVQPEGRVDKSNLSWYTEAEIYGLDQVDAKKCAENYWNEVPFAERHSLWEYRCRSAIVLKEIDI